MNLLSNIKNFFSKEKWSKNITNLAMLLVIGIIILIASSTFNSKNKGNSSLSLIKENNQENMMVKQNSLIDAYTENVEEKLEKILSQIKGVGKVKVMVTLEDTVERIPAINTTNSSETTSEKDAQGGVREVIREDNTKQVVVNNSGSSKSLVVIKEVNPKIKGVIVVAQGAEDIYVKERLYLAVKTVLDIQGNRVEIYPSK